MYVFIIIIIIIYKKILKMLVDKRMLVKSSTDVDCDVRQHGD